MLFRENKDWKQLLREDEELMLNEILKDLTKHRGAYKNAGDVKIAQIWCAILELKKQNESIVKEVHEINEVFKSIADHFQKKEKYKKELKDSLEKF